MRMGVIQDWANTSGISFLFPWAMSQADASGIFGSLSIFTNAAKALDIPLHKTYIMYLMVIKS